MRVDNFVSYRSSTDEYIELVRTIKAMQTKTPMKDKILIVDSKEAGGSPE